MLTPSLTGWAQMQSSLALPVAPVLRIGAQARTLSRDSHVQPAGEISGGATAAAGFDTAGLRAGPNVCQLRSAMAEQEAAGVTAAGRGQRPHPGAAQRGGLIGVARQRGGGDTAVAAGAAGA